MRRPDAGKRSMKKVVFEITSFIRNYLIPHLPYYLLQIFLIVLMIIAFAIINIIVRFVTDPLCIKVLRMKENKRGPGTIALRAPGRKMGGRRKSPDRSGVCPGDENNHHEMGAKHRALRLGSGLPGGIRCERRARRNECRDQGPPGGHACHTIRADG